MTVKIVILVLFFSVMIGAGMYGRKKVKTVGDFILGGRNVGPWLSAFTYGTTYFSAVIFIGYAGKFGWKYGLAATWIGIGNALVGSLLAWIVLGKKTRYMTHRLGASTMPEFFEKRYGSKSLRIVSSVIMFVFLVPYSASVYTGLSYLFEKTFGIPYIYCMCAMAVITALYLILGGFIATAMNDLIQGIIMIAGIVLITACILNNPQVGGLFSGIEKLKTAAGGLNNVDIFGGDPVNLLGIIILTSVGTWGLPQMIHKFYSIRDEKAIKTGTVISTLFAVLVAGGSYFIGAFCKLYISDPKSAGILLANGSINYDLVMPLVLETALPAVLMAVVMILVLSASMSTLSSLALVSSSTMTLDFIKELFAPKMEQKKQMLYIRILCGVFVFVSVVVALQKGAIVTLMSFSWGALAGSFLAPFFYGLFWKGVTRAGAWAGFVSAVSITVAGFAISLSGVQLSGIAAYITPPNIGALAMIVPMGLVPLVSVLTGKIEPRLVKNAFPED